MNLHSTRVIRKLKNKKALTYTWELKLLISFESSRRSLVPDNLNILEEANQKDNENYPLTDKVKFSGTFLLQKNLMAYTANAKAYLPKNQ